MGNFNKRDKFSGKKKYSTEGRGFRRDGGRDKERPTMHRAICSECGKSCEVPFKPTGEKPVFCSTCFGNKDTSNKSRSERRNSDRPFRDRQMFEVVCSKCKKTCEVPFKPSSDKPVYCSECFGNTERGASRTSGGNSSNTEEQKRQFDALHKKLDNILNILSSQKPSSKTIEQKVQEEKVLKEKPDNKKKPETKTKAELKKKVVAKKVEAKEPAKKKTVIAKKPVKKVVRKK